MKVAFFSKNHDRNGRRDFVACLRESKQLNAFVVEFWDENNLRNVTVFPYSDVIEHPSHPECKSVALIAAVEFARSKQ
jgi:hypothetical protein